MANHVLNDDEYNWSRRVAKWFKSLPSGMKGNPREWSQVYANPSPPIELIHDQLVYDTAPPWAPNTNTFSRTYPGRIMFSEELKEGQDFAIGDAAKSGVEVMTDTGYDDASLRLKKGTWRLDVKFVIDFDSDEFLETWTTSESLIAPDNHTHTVGLPWPQGQWPIAFFRVRKNSDYPWIDAATYSVQAWDFGEYMGDEQDGGHVQIRGFAYIPLSQDDYELSVFMQNHIGDQRDNYSALSRTDSRIGLWRMSRKSASSTLKGFDRTYAGRAAVAGKT